MMSNRDISCGTHSINALSDNQFKIMNRIFFWDVTLTELDSHCDTCKVLSGAPYTLNQIIPASNLSITKGKDSLGKYTYKGDSGKGVHCVSLPAFRAITICTSC
jgi:hypothetical protein